MTTLGTTRALGATHYWGWSGFGEDGWAPAGGVVCGVMGAPGVKSEAGGVAPLV